MATGISSPLALGGLFPSVDGGYVAANGKPFTSVSNAESALNGFPSKLSESCVGLTVLVKESGWPKAKEYWVQPKGTTPETYGLVEKGAGVTDYNDLDNKPTISDGVNTALPIVGNVKVSATTASGDTAGVTVTPGQNTGEIQMQFTLPKGNDAYEVYLEKYKEEHSGSTDGAMSKDAWLASLKGADGADGQDGQDGDPGADAVNPFKGYYPSGVSKPATGAVGDYLYAPPSDSQSTATATIWHYDANQTPPWTDTGIDVSAVVGVKFGSGQPVANVHIKDENGDEDAGAEGVLSAEAGKRLNVLSQSTEITLLDAGSPYFVRDLTNAYITKNLKRIDSNVYTTGYKLSLFLLPAGDYQATYLRDLTAEVVYLATISGDSEFTVGGHVDTLLIVGDTASVGEAVPISFSEDTYVVLCNSNTAGQYSNYCKLEQVSEDVTTVKDKVLELDSSVQGLGQTVRTTSEKVDKLELLKIKEASVAYQLENDYDYFRSSYGWAKIGQYTKIMDADTPFNVVRINKVGSVDCHYRVYLTNAGAGKTREVPTGVINDETHILLKEGTLQDTSDGYRDIEIKLDDFCICRAGYQVVVYLVSTNNNINIRGTAGGSGNSERTSNPALICSGSEPFGSSSWVSGSVNETANTGYFNVALTLLLKPLFVTEDGLDDVLAGAIPPIVNENIGLDLDIVIPDVVYAIVGTELNIWNDTVALSVDKGLMSPMNYQLRWMCNKGIVTDRCYRFKPTASDIGNVSCTCYIYDVRGKLVSSKTFTIKVLANDTLNSAKNIVYFGDSLGESAATALYNNFHSDRFGGTVPNMMGTKGNTIHFEAVGGYRWSDYATRGRRAFRCQVPEGVTVAYNGKYTNNGKTWTVVEVNTGNILITKNDLWGGTDAPLPEGELVPVSSGLSTITYTGATLEGANPLWDSALNDGAGGLSITAYKSQLVALGQLGSVSDKIDAVSFQFGINDNWLADDLETLHTYVSDLYHLFVDDNPNCKFIIGMTTSSGNDVNGAGANYGATWDYKGYLKNVYKIRKYYLTLLTEFPNIRIATPNLYLDRYYGYAFGTRQISDRYTATEQYHTNYVHPTTSGYNQMADAYLACYVGVLSE